MITLNDILCLNDRELSFTKIHLCKLGDAWSEYPTDPETVEEYAVLSKGNGESFPGRGENIIGLLRNPNNHGEWLFAGVFRIFEELQTTSESGADYGAEHLIDLKKYAGRIIVGYSDKSRNPWRHAKNELNLIEKLEVLEILRPER